MQDLEHERGDRPHCDHEVDLEMGGTNGALVLVGRTELKRDAGGHFLSGFSCSF
jgi:hypothetical protein